MLVTRLSIHLSGALRTLTGGHRCETMPGAHCSEPKRPTATSRCPAPVAPAIVVARASHVWPHWAARDWQELPRCAAILAKLLQLHKEQFFRILERTNCCGCSYMY